jgi:hypothetical protein
MCRHEGNFPAHTKGHERYVQARTLADDAVTPTWTPSDPTDPAIETLSHLH